MLGNGIVGGRLMSMDELSRTAADVADTNLERRTACERQRAATASPGPPIFDWRELQRWGIPESRLPPGSVVRYRAPSLWRHTGRTVLSAAGVLAVQRS